MRARLRIRTAVLAAVPAVSGCFAVVDVDRFHTESSLVSLGDSSAPMGQVVGGYTNLKFTLVGLSPHVTQLFEFRIVDATNFIQARGVVNPLGSPDAVINVPLAIPPAMNGPYHLDFYADVNGNGNYDGIGSVITNDHAWRIDPLEDYPIGAHPAVDGLTQVTFTHNTSFTDIDQYPSGKPNVSRDTSLGATIQVMNAGPLMGDLVQVRVVDPAAPRTLGLFRVPVMTKPEFNMTIPGVVEMAGTYEIWVYVDANNNDRYDNPAMGLGDLGWKLTGTADATGLNVTADLQDRTAANVDVGAP